MVRDSLPPYVESLQEELDGLVSKGLYRACRRVEAVQGGRILIEGRWLIHLASNSYLGLHQHPKVIAKAKEAIQRYGTSSGSARLIGGTLSLHEELEEALADFKRAESALVFPTGYMANLGIVTALVGKGDLVIGDRFNHASLIDACRLSGATFRVYPHGDLQPLESSLRQRQGKHRRILVVTESLFSMDGDLAPLPEVVDLTRAYGAWLLIDDAHASGVLGRNGSGSLEHFGIPSDGILQMGTLSKALASLGGYIAGPRQIIELLKNKARPFIYTTALPPASVAAALAALKVLQGEPQWLSRLWANVRQWVKGLTQLGLLKAPLSEADPSDPQHSPSPIVPIKIGSNERTIKIAQGLFENGVYAPGIRPPTVPAGSARIRTSVTALHTEEDLQRALEAFEKVRELFHEAAVR